MFLTFEHISKGSSVGYSITPICQDCGFNPQSGHIEERNECINKWNQKKIDVSYPL